MQQLFLRSQTMITVTLIALSVWVILSYGITSSHAAPPKWEAAPAPTAAPRHEPTASAKAAAAPAATFVGSETCAQCHDDEQGKLSKHWHGQVMSDAEKKGRGHLCEGCHGPGSVHANDPSAQTAAPLRLAAKNGTGCLSCHDTRVSALKWKMSEHAHAGTSCIVCHGQALPAVAPVKGQAQKPATGPLLQQQPIDPHGAICRKPDTALCLTCHGEKRAEFAMPSHHPVPEKRLDCVDCHNPHARVDSRKMSHELCVSCHVQKRGPFRYAHGAISGNLTDACLDCHRPHGSPNQQLLKFNSRGLCLQCHANKAAHFAGRTCWDCHTGVHGSNTNPLLFTP